MAATSTAIGETRSDAFATAYNGEVEFAEELYKECLEDDELLTLIDALHYLAEDSSLSTVIARLTQCQASALVDLLHLSTTAAAAAATNGSGGGGDREGQLELEAELLQLLEEKLQQPEEDFPDGPLLHYDVVDGISVSSGPEEVGVMVEEIPTNLLRTLNAFAHIEFSALLSRHQVEKLTGTKWLKRKLADNGVFGVPLQMLLDLDRSRLSSSDANTISSLTVPIIFQQLVEFVRENGLHQEGILRIPGSAINIKELIRKINLANVFPLSSDELALYPVNEVASVLKKFIRELPTPLLSLKGEHCKAAVNPASAFRRANSLTDGAAKRRAFNLLMLMLPEVNRNALKLLLGLLGDIVAMETDNSMTARNVACMMAPNLFLPSFGGKDPERMQLENAAMEACVVFLVENQNLLWTVPPNLVRQIRDLTQPAEVTSIKVVDAMERAQHMPE